MKDVMRHSVANSGCGGIMVAIVVSVVDDCCGVFKPFGCGVWGGDECGKIF